MVEISEADVDVDSLRKMYDATPTAKFIFDYFASRHKSSNITKTDRLLQVLYQQGQTISRAEVIEFFRGLEEARCGDYIEGRKGHPSRFVWAVNLITVGKAAAGVLTIVEEISSEIEEKDESEDNMLPHEYRLRPGLVIRFELPHDLSTSEASRLSDYIKTLPFA